MGRILARDQYIIKGEAIVESGKQEARSIAAIPCISYEQAIAASHIIGDARRAH